MELDRSQTCPHCHGLTTKTLTLYETKNNGTRKLQFCGSCKRPKYEAPKREHPDTVQDIESASIQANRLEVQNAALRRKIVRLGDVQIRMLRAKKLCKEPWMST